MSDYGKQVHDVNVLGWLETEILNVENSIASLEAWLKPDVTVVTYNVGWDLLSMLETIKCGVSKMEYAGKNSSGEARKACLNSAKKYKPIFNNLKKRVDSIRIVC